MKLSYAQEVRALRETYELARTADLETAEALVREASGAPTVFVGSGGAYPLAVLAATLHERYAGQPAVHLTPLGFASAPPMRAANMNTNINPPLVRKTSISIVVGET